MMAEADGEGQQEDAASNSRENRNDSLDAVRKISTMAYEDNLAPMNFFYPSLKSKGVME